MKRAIIFAVVFLSVSVGTESLRAAPPECDDGYRLCMAGCATERLPERCMQRCQQASERCSKSRVFKMPVRLILNKSRVEEMSHAQAEPLHGRVDK
jgi:hypothetical protein